MQSSFLLPLHCIVLIIRGGETLVHSGVSLRFLLPPTRRYPCTAQRGGDKGRPSIDSRPSTRICDTPFVAGGLAKAACSRLLGKLGEGSQAQCARLLRLPGASHKRTKKTEPTKTFRIGNECNCFTGECPCTQGESDGP